MREKEWMERKSIVVCPLLFVFVAAYAMESVDLLVSNTVHQVVRCMDVDTTMATGIPPGYEFGHVSASNIIGPLRDDLRQFLEVSEGETVNVSIVEQPKHGKLYPYPNVPIIAWGYLADYHYRGYDRVVFLVEANGKQLRVVLNLLVVNAVFDDDPFTCRNEQFEPENDSDSSSANPIPEITMHRIVGDSPNAVHLAQKEYPIAHNLPQGPAMAGKAQE
jgi:hypothetical protein